MKNKDLQEILKKHPDDMKIMLYPDCLSVNRRFLKNFDKENICDHAEDDRVNENGNLIKGREERVLVINPPIH